MSSEHQFELTPLRALAVLLCGALFGFGLAQTTMIQPLVVLGFLRGQDWGLMLVMGGALLMTLLAYRLVPVLLGRPLLGGVFARHSAVWNRDTLIGSALFGVGWGISGVCPGPAIAGLGVGNWDLLWALGGMLVGAGLHGATTKG